MKYSKRRGKGFRKGNRKSNQIRQMAGEKTARVPANVYKIAKILTGMKTRENTETKYADAIESGNVNNIGSYRMTINPIDQGTNFENRIGNKVTNQNLQIRYNAVMNGAAVRTLIRCMCVYDKKPLPIGTPPAWVDLMSDTDPLSFIDKNRGAGDRFVVLKNWTINLNENNPNKAGHFFVKLNGITSEWNEAVGTDFTKGAMYIFAIADQDPDLPALSIRTRLNFTDN